ncbi:hypothetical protein OGAPHI_000188 [Ogataea philodendri]|uniref:Uncharacterized protein n=1 Tax=Ogataea philodendri TaxID=1378263 RepID=A0A9P8PGG4_9ASCO|nr:uncharacterized protein OGAPHI_000188 [Ogataea philodendri]KAH3671486.1 hypothetical protein OGAPHI_000188 [Ogataea philodendri]
MQKILEQFGNLWILQDLGLEVRSWQIKPIKHTGIHVSSKTCNGFELVDVDIGQGLVGNILANMEMKPFDKDDGAGLFGRIRLGIKVGCLDHFCFN